MSFLSFIGKVASVASKVTPILIGALSESDDYEKQNTKIGSLSCYKSGGTLYFANPSIEHDVQMVWTSSKPNAFLSEIYHIEQSSKLPVGKVFDDFTDGHVAVTPIKGKLSENLGDDIFKKIVYSLTNIIPSGIPIDVTTNSTITINVDNSCVEFVVKAGVTIAGTYFVIRATDWLFNSAEQRGNLPDEDNQVSTSENGQNEYTYKVKIPNGIDLKNPLKSIHVEFQLPVDDYRRAVQKSINLSEPLGKDERLSLES